MDFVVKTGIFLAFVCLSLGVFGDVIEPYIENTVVSDVGTAVQFICTSSRSPVNFTWSMWPVGGQRMIAIASGGLVVDPETFETAVETNTERKSNGSFLYIKNVGPSTAGVYTCDEGQKQSAQFIVIFDESACNINTKPYETRSRDEISQFSCNMSYAANESYVVADMKWSIYGSSESLKSLMETSTSANITTATSTLNITRSENLKCVSIYVCTTTFSLTNNLPSGFATNEPGYARACSPNADACEEKYEPACNFAPQPKELPPRNEISQLSCIIKYAANAYYVFSNMQWSVDGSFLSLDSSMETSTSANITTAISTLNITTIENWCASIYRCTTTFIRTEKLPIGISLRGRPSYARECSLSVPNAAACETYQPVCNFAPEPNEGRPRDEISELSCTLKYAANDSYVVADMKWSIDGSSESLNSSMEASTYANITTTTSTLDITRIENLRCPSIFRCTTTFSLKDKLPIVFAWNKASFDRACSLSVPNSAACKYEKSTKKPHEKPRNRWTKLPDGNSVEKSGGNSDEEPDEYSDDEPGNNAGGLSVRSSKRNIVIKCVIGIAGFLLIGRRTGV